MDSPTARRTSREAAKAKGTLYRAAGNLRPPLPLLEIEPPEKHHPVQGGSPTYRKGRPPAINAIARADAAPGWSLGHYPGRQLTVRRLAAFLTPRAGIQKRAFLEQSEEGGGPPLLMDLHAGTF